MFWILVLVFVGGIGYLLGRSHSTEQTSSQPKKAKYASVSELLDS